jgi:two-component sensor histidine kinase
MSAPFDDSVLKSPNRLNALERTQLLDTPAEECFDRVTRLAARLLGCNTALLSLVDSDRQFFKSQCGLPSPVSEARQTPLSHSFCKHVVTSRAPLVVEDSRNHPLVSDNGAVTDFSVITYMGVPVHSSQGEVLGSLCVLDSKPRVWSAEDKQLLSDLARIIEDEVYLREHALKANVLAAENAVLAREYHHRVKNALAVSSALVKLSGKEASSIKDLIDKASGRLIALASAHDSLLAASDDIDLRELAARLLLPYSIERAEPDISGPQLLLRQEQVTPICLFLHELATNSAKYGAFRDGAPVSVRWDYEDARQVALIWTETLGDTAQPTANGFGTQLIEIAARQLGGRATTTWSDKALTVQLSFPTSEPSEQ